MLRPSTCRTGGKASLLHLSVKTTNLNYRNVICELPILTSFVAPDLKYRRLYEACLAMAEQSTDADMRARWLAIAEEAVKQFESEPPMVRILLPPER